MAFFVFEVVVWTHITLCGANFGTSNDVLAAAVSIAAAGIPAGRDDRNHGGVTMSERPVELFLPPDWSPPAALGTAALPQVPEPVTTPSSLAAAIAAIDHSGRVGDRHLITMLGWRPHDRVSLDIRHRAVTIRPTPEGPFRLDARRNALIPAAARAVLGIASSDRVLLVAALERNLLIVHPTSFLFELLTVHYASFPGVLNVY